MDEALTIIHMDPETGEAVPLDCPRCRDVEVGDVGILEKENRRLGRRIASLQADQQREREESPQRIQIVDLIRKWARHSNHPRANVYSADRFDIIQARLREGYSLDDVEGAIDGVCAYPYVVNAERCATGLPQQRHDRLGIALKTGEALERFANLGHQASKERDDE